MMTDVINIIYQPGYAGHFLSYLFSLDPSTAPHVAETDRIKERLALYDFSNAKKFDHWVNFHSTYDTHNVDQYQNLYPKIVKSVHPANFVYNKNESHYIVDLSYSIFASYWLIHTKELWGQYPILSANEYDVEHRIRKQFDPTRISIDAFLSPTTWVEEYLRITHHMGIPSQVPAAQKLYDSWYAIRVEPLLKAFDPKDTSYIKRRINDERQGQLTYWQAFYQRVRGDDWPDCNNERDFDHLPSNIKQELIEVFNYQPQDK